MKSLKTIIAVLCLTAMSPTVQAQKFGVKAGLNFANVTGNDFGDTKARTGFHVGVFKEITLVPELLFLVPEAQYSSQGFKSGDKDYSIDYVNIPVVAKVYILKLFSIEGGVYAGFKVGDNLPGNSGDGLKTLDTGIAAGVGLNFPLGLSINARFMQGVSEIADNSDAKNQVLQLGAAFKF